LIESGWEKGVQAGEVRVDLKNEEKASEGDVGSQFDAMVQVWKRISANGNGFSGQTTVGG
jgi:hypothetical protein